MMRRNVLIMVLAVASTLIASKNPGCNVLDVVREHEAFAQSAPTFVDVLDAPAVKSKLASRALFNGITRAGKRLIAVGQRGHILYSDNEGANWTQADVPVSSDLTAVNFPTPQSGWAVGHDGVILHSSDRGVSWTKQFDGHEVIKSMGSRYSGAAASITADVERFAGQGPDKPFLDVWFDDEKSGYVVGAFNLIFHTADGGKSWEPWFERTENPKRLHLYSIRRIGRDLFAVGEQGLILKLDERSSQLRAMSCPYNGTFFGLTGKAGALVAYGLRGNAYRSTNDGVTWQKVETGVPETLTASTVTRDGRIVMVTLLGNILFSEDGGVTFRRVAHQQTLPAAAVTETDGGKLALAGTRGLWMLAQ